MLSNKLLTTLPFLAAQAAAIELATKVTAVQDLNADIIGVLKVFYPNCEGLKQDLSKVKSGKGITCTDSIEENVADIKKLLREAQALGYVLVDGSHEPRTPNGVDKLWAGEYPICKDNDLDCARLLIDKTFKTPRPFDEYHTHGVFTDEFYTFQRNKL